MVAPAEIASCTCSARSHSTSTVRPGQRACARRTASRDADAGEVVVLDQHELGERATMVHAAAGAHRRLLDRTQTGQRLAGVPDPRHGTRGVDEPAGERGDAREVAEEVERAALAGEHRPQRTGHLADLGPGRDRVAVVEEPLHLHRGIDLREHLVGARGTREHAFGARHHVDRRARVGRDERGREVTEGPDVFGQCARHQRAHAMDRRVEVAHSCRLIVKARARWRAAGRTRGRCHP